MEEKRPALGLKAAILWCRPCPRLLWRPSLCLFVFSEPPLVLGAPLPFLRDRPEEVLGNPEVLQGPAEGSSLAGWAGG